MTSPTDNEIIEAVARAIDEHTVTGTDCDTVARIALSVATPAITEKVLRELWVELGRPPWLSHWIGTHYGITLDGDGNGD